MKSETKVIFYKNRKSMEKGLEIMQKEGWEVVSTETVKGNYGCLKVSCLGCLFLPLALLGKSNDEYKVHYKREVN